MNGIKTMNKYTCSNKRCCHEFYSSEDKPIILCPICSTEILNVDKVINTDNFLWIESMFKNISVFGKEKTFKMIDDIYINPITRAKVRKIYFEALKVLGKEKKDEY